MMHVICVALALATMTTMGLHAQPAGPIVWSADHPGGPGGGGAFATIGASASGIVVAASDLSGAYLSFDRGQSWEVVGADRGLATTHVGGLGFHPTDGNLIYFGGEDGIYRTDDAGASVMHVLDTGYIEDIAISESDSSIGYAAWHPAYDSTSGGIYKTTDNGLSWSRVDLDLPDGLRIIKVLVSPDSADSVYLLSGEARFAAGLVRAFHSSDGGVHWGRIGSAFGDRLLDLATSPHDPNRIWASVDDSDPDAPGHLWRSDDRGVMWTQLAQRGGVIWADRDDPLTIRMIDPRFQFVWDTREGIWESTDGGQSFARISSRADWDAAWSGAFWAITESFSGPVLTLGEDLSDGDALYWANGQFAFATFDRGHSLGSIFADEQNPGFWASRGLDNIVTMKIAISDADPDVLFLGSFDIGLWRSLDGGLSWGACNRADSTGSWEGWGGNTLSIVTDPQDVGTVWAPQAEAWAGPGMLLKSTDTGTTWSVVGAGLPASPLLGLSLDRTSPVGNRTLFITAGGDVYRSTDDGASFALCLADGGLSATAVDWFNGQIVYAGGASGLWRSVSGGLPGTWQQVGPAAFVGAGGFAFWDDGFTGVFDITPDPLIPGRVYASVRGSGQYVSDDAGVSWTQLLMDEFARSIAVSFDDPDVLFAASSSALLAGGYDPGSLGLLRSDDGGATWESLNAGLPYPFAVSMALDPRDPCSVMIASPGVGFRRGTAECPCRPDTNRDGQLTASDFTAWIAAFNSKNPVCDQNSDGSCTPSDFTAWIVSFNAGCP